MLAIFIAVTLTGCAGESKGNGTWTPIMFYILVAALLTLVLWLIGRVKK